MSAKERAEALAVEAVHPKAKTPKAEPLTLAGVASRLDTLIALMSSNVKSPKAKSGKAKVAKAPKAETPGDAALKPFRNVLQHPTTGAQTLGNLAFDVLIASPKLAVRVRDGKGSIYAAREVYDKVATTGIVTVKPYAGEAVSASARWDKASAKLVEVASK